MFTVELYVYDLSKGMAKLMSLPLTGKQFDGIWHTSLVVHDIEHYYSQGINSITPLSSEHGVLVKKLPMGTTTLTSHQITQLLTDFESVFTPDAYHIINHNCNHFTDAVLLKMGTIGRCPDDIMNLAKEVMATPFGSMVQPLFEKMFLGKREKVNADEIRGALDGLIGKEDGDVVFGALQAALD